MLTAEIFNQMVELHGQRLYRLAYRLVGKSHLAEDIVQNTFHSLWKMRDRYDTKINSRALLTTILHRRAADHHRLKLPKTNFPLEFGTEDFVYTEDLSPSIQNALSQLNQEIRETFLLVVVGELTHQEAASVLKVPLGTILSRVSRGRSQLRILLQEKETVV